MTKDQMIEKLATHYAYYMMACPYSTDDIDSVLNSWKNNKHHQNVELLVIYEDIDPEGLYNMFDYIKDSYLKFAKKILEKESTI